MESPRTDKYDLKSHRKRSRSPYRHPPRDEVRDARSRSPHGRHNHHHHRHRHRPSPPANICLPFRCSQLHKSDLGQYRNLLAEYLDVQKSIDITAISEDEIKGRWKSFLRKWNRKELAEGWYDPGMKTRVDERFASQPAGQIPLLSQIYRASHATRNRHEPDEGPYRDRADQDDLKDADDEDEDGYGPSLPITTSSRVPGPAIPGLQDLQQRDELASDDRIALAASERSARRLEYKQQAERLDELVPRADPGSRERQLEKKRATAEANRGFREAKSPGAAEVGERDLMGADDGGAEGFRARLQARDRIKNEREIRKEEVLRARAAEREERLAEHRRKEEKTMDALKAIAKQRFG